MFWAIYIEVKARKYCEVYYTYKVYTSWSKVGYLQVLEG